MSNTPKVPAKVSKPNRTAPKLEKTGPREVTVKVDHEMQLRDLYGVRTKEMGSGIFKAALTALGENGESMRDMVTAMAVEMEPTDAVEAMLVSQMALTFALTAVTSGKAMDAPSYKLRESYERSLTRLNRTYLAQMDALKRYRAKAQQVVRVERVSVHEGGQAIVGAVQAGGRGIEEK